MFLSSAIGNAIGLAGGVLLARQCFNKEGPEIQGQCGTFTNALAGITAVGLPIAGAALGARLAGATDISQGSLVPSMVGAGLMVFPGIALSISEAANSSSAIATVGAGLLAVGVPLAVTLADKLYRRIR